VTQSTFKSRNGDMLGYLTQRKESAEERHSKARKKLEEVEVLLTPLRKETCDALVEKLNISARLNAWWLEYREATASKAGIKLPIDSGKKVT